LLLLSVLGRWGNNTKARAVIGVGQELLFSPKRIISSFRSWIYIEWETLIWGVSYSFYASSASLKGVLHHPKHRAIDFIDITSENRKYRLFSAW